MKQHQLERCPMYRQYFLYDFRGNCHEMSKFLDTLTKNEVLITTDNNEWKVFHVSKGKGGHFICDILEHGMKLDQFDEDFSLDLRMTVVTPNNK